MALGSDLLYCLLFGYLNVSLASTILLPLPELSPMVAALSGITFCN